MFETGSTDHGVPAWPAFLLFYFLWPGRWHMFATVGRRDLKVLLAMPGVRERVDELMATFQCSNAMRSMPSDASSIHTVSGEDFIAWIVYCSPGILIRALDECGQPVAAYMWRCFHVVVTMAFQYPVLKSQVPWLMSMAKQYCATKQLHPCFGRRHSTFSNFAVYLCALTSRDCGSMMDTSEYGIDDQLGQASRGPRCQPGRERHGAKFWQTLVSTLCAHPSSSILNITLISLSVLNRPCLRGTTAGAMPKPRLLLLDRCRLGPVSGGTTTAGCPCRLGGGGSPEVSVSRPRGWSSLSPF